MKKVVSLSYGKQSINKKDIECVINVLKSDWLTQGPNVINFEKSLNKYFGGKYCSVVSNGTNALFLAGKVLGWKKKDIVITTPITFLATVNSIEYNNSTPDFVDINMKDYNLDVNILEDKIKKYRGNKKKIKAVIAVDYAGQPCDWQSLRYLANKYNFQLVNDNCHALGSSYLKNKKYSTKYADLVIQSFHAVKNITSGEGGAILTNNKYFDTQIKNLRTHGIIRDKKILKNYHGDWYYEMHKLGFNYRLSDIHCALGISQLKKLDSFVDKRRLIAKKYNEIFINNPNLIIPFSNKNIKHSYHLYPLQIIFRNIKINKRDLFKKLKKKGINLMVHYIPVHTQPYYKKKYNYNNNELRNSLEFYKNVVSLPIYNNLSGQNIEYISEEILKHVK